MKTAKLRIEVPEDPSKRVRPLDLEPGVYLTGFTGRTTNVETENNRTLYLVTKSRIYLLLDPQNHEYVSDNYWTRLQDVWFIDPVRIEIPVFPVSPEESKDLS